MTKEELKQEAEEWLRNNLHSASEEDFIKAMVDIAEPREKRIAELENENKILAQNLEDTEILNKTLTERDKEQKAQIEKMKCCGNCYYFNISKNIGTGNLFCDLKDVKNEYCKNKDHWK